MNRRLIIPILIFVFSISNLLSSDFDLGISYIISENYKLAEYIFRKSYISGDNELQSLLFLAHMCYINKKYKEAKELYFSLLNTKELTQSLANFVKFMYAECCIFLGDYSSSVKVLNEIDISIDPLLAPYILYNKIFALYKLAEYNSVLSNILIFKSYIKTKKINNNKIEEQIDYLLAETWFAKGNYKNAIDEFKNFTARYKNSKLLVFANIRLATIYDEQKKYDMSESVLRSINFKEYTTPEIELIIKYNLGKILSKQNKFYQAITIYQQLLKDLNNTNHEILPNLYLELAYCYYKVKNYDKVITILSNIKDKDRNKNLLLSLNYNYLLGLAYYNTKNYEDAIKIFSKAVKFYSISSNKWYYDMLYWLGLSYYKQGQYKKSIQTLLQFEKNKSSIYYIPAQIYVSKSYREMKEYELAKMGFNKLLENKSLTDIKTRNIILFDLAECYRLTGEYQTAIHYYNQIISTKDQNMINSAKVALAEVYNCLGDYSNSEKIIEEIINLPTVEQGLLVKAFLIYLNIKYNKGDLETTEKIATSLLKKDKFANMQEKKFVLSLLINLYAKTNNIEKTMFYTEKLSEIIEDENEKFILQTKILKLLILKGKFQEIYSRINELKKQYRASHYLCILNYYLLKYYSAVGQPEMVSNILSTMRTFLPEDYKYFTINELKNLIDICITYNAVDFTYIFAESVVPLLYGITEKDKFEIVKKVVEELINQKKFTSVLKLASVIKKISTDSNILSYSEFVIGKIYELTDKSKLAESVYTSILEKYPDSEFLPNVYIALIKYYALNNKIELAQFYEEQFISKFKNTNYVYEYIYEKSLSLVKNGKYEEAIKNLLLILDDKNVNTDKTALAQKLLADCYYNMGKYKEAVVEYLRVIYLYPDKTNLCAEAQYMVGICAEKLNLYDEAKKAYQHSIIKYPGTLWAQEAELKLKKLK